MITYFADARLGDSASLLSLFVNSVDANELHTLESIFRVECAVSKAKALICKGIAEVNDRLIDCFSPFSSEITMVLLLLLLFQKSQMIIFVEARGLRCLKGFEDGWNTEEEVREG